LADLASIAETQLQAALAVSRAAYLRLWPEDSGSLGSAKYVVVNGCRRLAAAHKYGRADLDILVKDEVAKDRATLIAASVKENVDRRDFDVIEEAKAVEMLVAECGGRGDRAAEQLGKTAGWVSQRRALLKLTAELQAKLRSGDLAIRHARLLGRVPQEEQVAAWQAELDKEAAVREGASAENDPAKVDKREPREPATADTIAKALRRLAPEPATLAQALFDLLGTDGVRAIAHHWATAATSGAPDERSSAL
jgi:ParB family chromosome partitioning protein